MGIGDMKAVFLDRDGVLTEPVVVAGKPYAPETIAQIRLYPEAPLLLGRLKELGFLLIVVTNQPDVARGTLTPTDLAQMHDVLTSSLPLDDILVCCHDDSDRCECRKPKPGMLLEAVRKHRIDLRASFLIGDRWRDVEAGAAAGCRTVEIDRGYRERRPAVGADAQVGSLGEAVEWIIRQMSE